MALALQKLLNFLPIHKNIFQKQIVIPTRIQLTLTIIKKRAIIMYYTEYTIKLSNNALKCLDLSKCYSFEMNKIIFNTKVLYI